MSRSRAKAFGGPRRGEGAQIGKAMESFVYPAGVLQEVKAYWVKSTGELLWVLTPFMNVYLGSGSSRPP